jgi:hypothetical protein
VSSKKNAGIMKNAGLAHKLYRLVNRQKHLNIARYPPSTEHIQNLRSFAAF